MTNIIRKQKKMELPRTLLSNRNIVQAPNASQTYTIKFSSRCIKKVNVKGEINFNAIF